MKKIFEISILLLFASAAFAQKPVQGDMGFTFGINGLSTVNVTTNVGNMSTLLFRYYLQDDLALRGGLNVTLTNTKFDLISDTSGNEEHDITKGHSVNLNVGVQKNFAQSMKRIEPYITGELTFGIGKLGIMENTSDLGPDFTIKTEVNPGNTTSFGLISNVGFNYFFTDHLAFGAEFGYGLQFSSTGDGTNTTTISQTGQPTQVTTTSTASTKSFSLSGTGGVGLITFSVFFGK